MCFGSSPASAQVNPAPHSPEETYKDVEFSTNPTGAAPKPSDTPKPQTPERILSTLGSGLSTKGM